MEASNAVRGKNALAALIALVVAASAASPGRAESLALQLADDGPTAHAAFPGESPAVQYAPCGRTAATAPAAGAAKSFGLNNLLGLLTAGTVLYEYNTSDFNPQTTTVDNPPVTDITPSTDITVPKDGSTDKDGGIQGGPSTPEPASLLIGLIGSACAGLAVWNRRRRKTDPTDAVPAA